MNTIAADIIILTDASFGFYLARNYLQQLNKRAIFITCSPLLYEKSKQDSHIVEQILFKKKRGFSRYNRQASHELITILHDVLQKNNISEAWFHELYSLPWNTAAHYIKEKLGGSKIFLLTDGTFNMFSKPMNLKQSISQSLLSVIHEYYQKYQGDWYGVDARFKGKFLAEKIILPNGMPNEYDANRVQYFSFKQKENTTKSNRKKALVVEQSLFDRGYLNLDTKEECINKIIDINKKNNIEETYIVAHPKAKERDFYHQSFIDISYDELSLEEHILDNNYDLIYSGFSTIFLLSKSMTNSKFISVGLDKIQRLEPLEGYKKNLKAMGVTIIT